jgi:hypothetical protein
MPPARIMPRCPVKGCPVRYRGGPDRLCPAHQDEHGLGVIGRAAEYGIDQAPDGRDRGDGETKSHTTSGPPRKAARG